MGLILKKYEDKIVTWTVCAKYVSHILCSNDDDDDDDSHHWNQLITNLMFCKLWRKKLLFTTNLAI